MILLCHYYGNGYVNRPWGIMILKDEWHMKYHTSALKTEWDIEESDRNFIVGSFNRLMDLANRKIDIGVWESAWLFPPESNSSLDIPHPGNPYWSGASDGWHYLDE
jgi:hypothetical protein